MANDEINIMTIEDPVEYNLKGIAQIGVHHKIKLDFARPACAISSVKTPM